MTQVTLADVERIAGGYDQDPARSMSLRADAYTEPMWADVEVHAIFARTWQWICHVEKLREPGGYVSATVAGMPVAVVRDRSGSCGRSTTCASTARTSCCPARAPRATSSVPTTRGPTASTASSRPRAGPTAWTPSTRRRSASTRCSSRSSGGWSTSTSTRRGLAGRAGGGPGRGDRALGAGRRRPHPRQAAHLRRGDQLEERHRQLPGVLPLPHRAQGVRRPGRHGHLRGAHARDLVEPLRRGGQARQRGVRRLGRAR